MSNLNTEQEIDFLTLHSWLEGRFDSSSPAKMAVVRKARSIANDLHRWRNDPQRRAEVNERIRNFDTKNAVEVCK